SCRGSSCREYRGKRNRCEQAEAPAQSGRHRPKRRGSEGRKGRGPGREDSGVGQLVPSAAWNGRISILEMMVEIMIRELPQFRPSRRDLLKSASGGFGMLALAGMLGQNGVASAKEASSKPGPLAPKEPHFPVKAKRIIFLFMEGAMSQMDTFEYKPKLQESDGKTGPGGGVLTASKFKFAQYGETGTWVSELYPSVAKHVDKLCFIR